MFIKILFLSIFLLQINCSNIEFIYDQSIKNNILEKKTITEVSGDDSSLVHVDLKKRLGKNKKDPKYKLVVSSQKTINNLVVQNNQTATQIEVAYKMNYTLQKISNLCIISKKEIITKADYKVKSSGYSFGSDTSRSNIMKQTIEKNIKIFLEHIIYNYPSLKCKNEG